MSTSHEERANARAALLRHCTSLLDSSAAMSVDGTSVRLSLDALETWALFVGAVREYLTDESAAELDTIPPPGEEPSFHVIVPGRPRVVARTTGEWAPGLAVDLDAQHARHVEQGGRPGYSCPALVNKGSMQSVGRAFVERVRSGASAALACDVASTIILDMAARIDLLEEQAK